MVSAVVSRQCATATSGTRASIVPLCLHATPKRSGFRAPATVHAPHGLLAMTAA